MRALSSLQLVLLFLLLTNPHILYADVVKPALIEISAYTDGRVVVDIRASLEALLSGINSRYKNTQDAPTAAEYDVFRKMPAHELRAAFTPFEARLLATVKLYADDEVVPLSVSQIDIPEPGYTKVPRISTLLLNGTINVNSQTLRWYYPEAFGDNAVRVRQVDAANERWHWSEWQWLRNDKASDLFTLNELFHTRPMSETVLSYIRLGFEHILPRGLDHILFILGLFLLSAKFKPLLWQVTMFTLAHTITLGLAMNGIVELSARIVEPLIALSIAYVGIENIIANTLHKKHWVLHKSRLVLVFGFGLLHGLGFASVLKDFGMPEGSFMTALISFNVGVELGQLAVITGAFALVYLLMQRQNIYRRLVVVPSSTIIAIIGFFWTIERIVA